MKLHPSWGCAGDEAGDDWRKRKEKVATHNKSGVKIVRGDTVDIISKYRSIRGMVTYVDCDQFGDEPRWSIELNGVDYWKQESDGGRVELVAKGKYHE